MEVNSLMLTNVSFTLPSSLPCEVGNVFHRPCGSVYKGKGEGTQLGR